MSEKIREHGRPTMGAEARAVSGVPHEAKYFAVSPAGHLVSHEDRHPLPPGHRLATREDLEKAHATAKDVVAGGGKVDEAGFAAVEGALRSLGWREVELEYTDEHHDPEPAELPADS